MQQIIKNSDNTKKRLSINPLLSEISFSDSALIPRTSFEKLNGNNEEILNSYVGGNRLSHILPDGR